MSNALDKRAQKLSSPTAPQGPEAAEKVSRLNPPTVELVRSPVALLSVITIAGHFSRNDRRMLPLPLLLLPVKSCQPKGHVRSSGFPIGAQQHPVVLVLTAFFSHVNVGTEGLRNRFFYFAFVSQLVRRCVARPLSTSLIRLSWKTTSLHWLCASTISRKLPSTCLDAAFSPTRSFWTRDILISVGILLRANVTWTSSGFAYGLMVSPNRK